MQGMAGPGPEDGPFLRLVAGGRDDHDALPAAGTARLSGGVPADLTRPSHYPCEAVCQECGRPIRCDRWFQDSFYHIPAFTLAGEP